MPYITGSSGYDNINGSSGSDTIIGNAGNDQIKGNGGNDYYVFNRGDGQDTLIDSGGNDIISFGSEISLSDLQFFRSANNLIIRIKDTIDKIDIKNWFTGWKVENIKFTNGSSITGSYAESNVDGNTKVIIATSESDNINAGSGNSLIYAMQGNDKIITSGGNNIIEPSSGEDKVYNYGSGSDTVYGSPGNDYIEDHGGNDRYIYQKGDGTDTIIDTGGSDIIRFGTGIGQNNLVFRQSGYDRVISFNNTSGKIIIKDWYFDTRNIIEKFVFSDGSTGESPDIPDDDTEEPSVNIIPTVTGTDGYDYFKGYNGNDVYYAKKGNDRLIDYSGGDTYLFNKGDGRDSITDTSGTDTIMFGAGISKNDIVFTRNSGTLGIALKDSNDNINIVDWFTNKKYQIEKISFNDGSYLTSSEVNNIIQAIASSAAGSGVQITGMDASTQTVFPVLVQT